MCCQTTYLRAVSVSFPNERPSPVPNPQGTPRAPRNLKSCSQSWERTGPVKTRTVKDLERASQATEEASLVPTALRGRSPSCRGRGFGGLRHEEPARRARDSNTPEFKPQPKLGKEEPLKEEPRRKIFGKAKRRSQKRKGRSGQERRWGSGKRRTRKPRKRTAAPAAERWETLKNAVVRQGCQA